MVELASFDYRFTGALDGGFRNFEWGDADASVLNDRRPGLRRQLSSVRQCRSRSTLPTFDGQATPTFGRDYRPIDRDRSASREDSASRRDQGAEPDQCPIRRAIAKYPDFDAAEAISRVPGVSLTGDTGEGRFVNIRGIDNNLNGTTFGGVVILNTQPQGTLFGSGRGWNWTPSRWAPSTASS